MNKKLFIITSMLIMTGFISLSEAALFVPKDGKVMMLIGQDRKSIKDYIHSVGITPPGFMVYTSIQEMDGLFGPAIDRGAGIQDARSLEKKYKNAVYQVGLYMVGALRDTYKGKYDRNIDKLTKWLEKVRVPVYLRIGYEFDLPANKYRPEDYIKAYRYIVEKLRDKGVKNVSFVWHSYGVINENKPISDWYPGDDVVDWIALSYFKTYFHADRVAVAEYARDKGKPLMIAEAAPSQIGSTQGAKAWERWYVPFFQFIQDYDVKVACYINTDWDSHRMFRNQSWGDSRVQSHPLIYSKWRDALRSGVFLHPSVKLFKMLEK